MKKLGILSLVFLLHSCHEDECKGKMYYTADERVIKAIPYVDKQTISFKTNKGETFSAGVKRSIEVSHSDLMCDELLHVTLNIGNSTPFMDFLDRASFDQENSVIQCAISPYRNNVANGIQILIKADGELVTKTFMGKSVFHQTIIIDGRSYNKVLELLYPDSDPKSINQVFYSITQGFIQFKTVDGLVVTQTTQL